LEKSVCLYVNKETFLQFCGREDLKKLKQLTDLYTDYDLEGRQLLSDMASIKV